jgi:broad specificity phosphatase PhoE
VLSERGVEQAAVLARDFARRGIAPRHAVTGDLRRQRDTLAPLGLPTTADPRWNEYDTDAIMSAHSSSAAREHRGPGDDAAPALTSRQFQEVLEEALLAWIAAGADGPSREPWPAFAERVGAALRDAASALGAGETGVVCTSGGVLAAIMVALLDVPAATFVRFNRVTVNTGISRVAVGRSGMTLVSFNEHAHLDGDLLTYR